MASETHLQAEQEREKGNFTQALKLYKSAIASYEEAKDYQGVTEALQGRFLTYKHLFWQTGDITYAQSGNTSLESSLKIALKNKLPTTMIYFSLGECSMLFENYEQAVENYNRAVYSYVDGPHIGNLHTHLGEAIYLQGRKDQGYMLILQGIKEIQEKAGELGDYVKDVWESGANLKLAKLLWQDNPYEARTFLNRADKIIHANPSLILRKKQLEELQDRFS